MKSIVVFSGGQDSTTCLLKALHEGDEVIALSFNYRQKNCVELTCANKICELLNVEHRTLDISSVMDAISDTPYLRGEELSGKSSLDESLPSTWVPNRNLLFAVLAHSFAAKMGFDKIILGVNSVDYSGYPDCRPEFVESLRKVLGLSVPGKTIQVDCPLLHLSKEEIWGLANSLGKLSFITQYTHTCYNGDHQTWHEWGYGCGECDACKIRKSSFEEFSHAVRNPSV